MMGAVIDQFRAEYSSGFIASGTGQREARRNMSGTTRRGEPDRRLPVLMLAGPTASGKSALALALAARLEQAGRQTAVLINADSMQLYRELSIVTARPDAAALAAAEHRLYGVLAATDNNSAGNWRNLALREIAAAHEAGKLPILVGGTGFYLKALLDGLSPIPPIPDQIDLDTRDRLEARGVAALYADLKARDPVMAGRLDPGDVQRIARAWSVLMATGMSLADWQALPLVAPPGNLRFVVQVVMPRRDWLYPRCDARFSGMIEAGAVDEVRAFLALKPPAYVPLLRAVGVPEISAHLAGGITLDEAVRRGQQATRNYAKRQYTWFRNQLSPTPDTSRAGQPVPKVQISHVRDAQLSESLWAEIEKNIQ